MAVGTDGFTCYENEDVTITLDTSVAGIVMTGQVIKWVLKSLATDPDPPLLSGTMIVDSANSAHLDININVAAGSYVGGVRRTDASHATQYNQGDVTVLASVNEDH